MTSLVGFVLAMPYNARGVSYTCGMIAGGMAGGGLDVTMVTPRARRQPPAGVRLVESLPPLARRLPYRAVRAGADAALHRRAVQLLAGGEAGRTAAYLWGEVPVRTFQALREAGVLILREKVNCHKASAKRILDDAHRREGLTPHHHITPELIAKETEELALVDHVFCPNAFVESTLLENGVSEDKLLPTSYGWDPARLAGTHRLLETADGPTYLFVGSICLRKGAHLLLRAWAESGIKGRLVLAGGLEPQVGMLCRDILERDDVVVMDYVTDVGALYRSADVFVFPSLEEGGPQVTYEAYGCGLPAVVSPMGAGRIARHGSDAYIVDPTDAEAWIGAMRALADPGHRAVFAEAARARSREFTWEVVGRRRRRILERLLDSRREAPAAARQTAHWQPGQPPLDAKA